MLATRIGAYEIIRRVAAGAMSEVYEARDVRNGRQVAVKVLHREWCVEDTLVARFCNEARALEEIRHPHIIEIFGHGRLPDGVPFMLLEWLPFTLGHVLSREGGMLAMPIAVRIASCISAAIAVMHERGVVHRDLKPANVLLSREDARIAEVKLADLGVAKLTAMRETEDQRLSLSPVSTGGTDLLGTCEYMAPEQWIQSKSIDPKADVYALGILLFQLLTGQLPFSATTQQDLMCLHLFEKPPLQLLDASAGWLVKDWIARMLDKHPAQRPSMEEVTHWLTARTREYPLESP